MKLCPAKFFIALLATLDTASLICKLIRNIGRETENYKVVEFLILYTTTLASWILVLICAERFCTVCFKDKKPLIFSLRNCYIAVAVLSTSLFIIFISMRMIYPNFDFGTPTAFTWFWKGVWYLTNPYLYMFLPLTMIIPMTALMLRKLLGSNRDGILQQNDDPSESLVPAAGKSGLTEEELENNKRTFTVMICIAAMFFVILCLLVCVFYLYTFFHDDHLTSHQQYLFMEIQFILPDSTHAINFFLYFVPARQFRAKVVDVFCCRPCRKNSYDTGQGLALELTSDGSQSSQKKMSC